MRKNTALLTGAAGGLGSCTARYLCERGWRVFAADSSEPGLAALGGIGGITPVPMDVTDPDSIAAAYRLVEGQADGLDGLVNMAGTIALGSVVELDEPALFQVLNVNALGTYRVNRTFFPLVLRRKGRIVNMSSETGWQSGGPFNGPYAMSKHMVEAYSDSLRRELMFLGVAVIKLQPGPFRTETVRGLPAAVDRAIEASAYFKEVLARMKGLVAREYGKAHDPVLVARVVHKALTAAHPRACYSVRPDPLRVLLERLPVRWADALVRKWLSG